MKNLDRKDVLKRKRKNVRPKGARNLIILGVVSILVAVSTTGVSLAIYHNSGDIYLDRSRPGFLPDKKEIEETGGNEPDEEYEFEKSGKITNEVIDEYLRELDEKVRAIDSYEKPFSDSVLSDENLGITEKTGSGEPALNEPTAEDAQVGDT